MASRSRNSPPPEPPRLRRARADAEAAVKARIQSGLQLVKIPILTKAELDQLRDLSYTWNDGNKALLQQLFSSGDIADAYAQDLLIGSIGGQFDLAAESEDAKGYVKRKVRRLEGIVEQIQFMEEAQGISPTPRPGPVAQEPLARLAQLSRFDRFVRELGRRHGGRDPIEVQDEYDMQDLLRAVLALDFDDVRPEEWTPSYAGGSSRVDFPLKAEKIVVETKRTRSGLGDRELGDQLTIDIARYRAHPDCETLVCLIYDPDHIVRNAMGLKRDLELLGNPPHVNVIITPL